LLKGCTTQKDFDLVIKNGLVYDGLGSSPVSTDIGIQGDIIGKIGKIPSGRGKHVIDAQGLSITPGFIDVHDHTDIGLLVNPKAESAVRQGITTLVSGNCGSSPFPVAEAIYDEFRENLQEIYKIQLDWIDLKGFFSQLEQKGMAVNYATLVGQGTIRGAVVGFNDRAAKPEEVEKMKNLVENNIKDGAFGLSSGLEYAPGSYASSEEIIELCRVVSRMKGVYATHMRDEGDRLLESLEESVDVSRRTGVTLQISHFKVAYPRNWNKLDDALSKLENAQKEGISVFCDRYPYTAGSTGLSFYFPLWARQGTTEKFLSRLKNPSMENRLREYVRSQEEKLGSWDKVFITSVVTDKNQGFQGKNILQAAKETGKDPYEFMRDILIEEENQVGMVSFMMTEENLRRVLSFPLVGIGCDGSAIAPYGLLGRGKPHPRSYGTFPRVLGKYVRDEKISTMEEMIKKITSIPADRFGFSNRGKLQPGYLADIVVFDEKRIKDQATYEDPHQYPVGIEYVLVNGQTVIDKGEHSGNLPGRILRKKAVQT
jgi:N-acyl-D-amino-acid deacylase